MGRAERGLVSSRMRLASSSARLDHLGRALSREVERYLQSLLHRLLEAGQRLGRSSPRHLAACRRLHVQLGERIAAGSTARLREWSAVLEGKQRLCTELAPEKTLERGFSVTRDGAGRLLVDPAQVGSGDQILTRLAHGELISRVEGR